MIESVIAQLTKVYPGDSYQDNLIINNTIAGFLFNSHNDDNPEDIALLGSHLVQNYIQNGMSEKIAKHTVYWNLLCSANVVSLHDFYLNFTGLAEYSRQERKIELM